MDGRWLVGQMSKTSIGECQDNERNAKIGVYLGFQISQSSLGYIQAWVYLRLGEEL